MISPGSDVIPSGASGSGILGLGQKLWIEDKLTISRLTGSHPVPLLVSESEGHWEAPGQSRWTWQPDGLQATFIAVACLNVYTGSLEMSSERTFILSYICLLLCPGLFMAFSK